MLAAYKAAEGDMNVVVDSVMLAETDDIGRFVHSYVLPAIERGEAKRFRNLAKFEKRPVVAAATAKQPAKRKNENEGGNLVALIQSRQSSHAALISGLESKYGGGGGKGKKRASNEPSEEEFARIQAELEARRASKK